MQRWFLTKVNHTGHLAELVFALIHSSLTSTILHYMSNIHIHRHPKRELKTTKIKKQQKREKQKTNKRFLPDSLNIKWHFTKSFCFVLFLISIWSKCLDISTFFFLFSSILFSLHVSHYISLIHAVKIQSYFWQQNQFYKIERRGESQHIRKEWGIYMKF